MLKMQLCHHRNKLQYNILRLFFFVVIFFTILMFYRIFHQINGAFVSTSFINIKKFLYRFPVKFPST